MEKKLMSLIKKADVISFDLFDTLVLRKVEKPTDIFKLVELEYKKVFKVTGDKKFCDDRKEAEVVLSMKNPQGTTLDDIYQKLEEKYTVDEVLFLKNMEIEIEQRCLVKNHSGVEAYNFAKSLNKTIILTSDMYLPKYFLKKITHSFGMQFDEIFVSCEVNATKSSGEMFKLLKQKYACKKIVHIGDNYKSDYLRAKINGVMAYYLKSRHKPCVGFEAGIINKLIFCESQHSGNELDFFGYKYLGPLLVGFCNWIHSNTRENESLIFLSRDGWLMKRAYDALFPDNKSQYFYASRKALINPKFALDASYQNIFNSYFFRKSTCFNDVINKIGCNGAEVQSALKECGIEGEKYYPLEELKTNKSLEVFFDKYIKEKLKQKSTIQLNYLKEYINKNSTNKINIVDIGWFGNMQKALEQIINTKHFRGYYLGTLSQNENNNGYLFDIKKDLRNFYKEHFFNALFELLFISNHGTVIEYSKNDDGQIKPVLGKFNNDDYAPIYRIQNSALRFISDLIGVLGPNYIYPHSLSSFHAIIDYCLTMKKKSIEQFKDLVVEDIGREQLISVENNKIYIKKSAWKMGAITLKYNIRVGKIFSFLYKFYYKFKRRK